MKPMFIAVGLILLSASATVTLLAACGSYFSPGEPNGSNLTLWGTYCNNDMGGFGKTHTWHLYYTNGHDVPNLQVTEAARCPDGAHGCYAEFFTPVWTDSNKTTWNEVTQARVFANGVCEFNAAEKDHRFTYYCQPAEAEDEDTCTANNWYWNFESTTCHATPQSQVQCAIADWYWNFTSNGCVDTPADGMCGGSPDWGNYPSTACYTSGLGIFSGICNRSTAFISRCFQDNGDYDNHYCTCGGCDWCGGSPIVIDVSGNRYDMTDVSQGVTFDLNGNGTADKLSWTKPGSSSMWLTLDGNHDGTIDSGKELFGNFTFQSEPPAGVEKNGFRALAEYDKPENGGNGDGNIDAHDAVWSHLQLWQDANQNGISEPAELHLLSEFGIESISLDYRQSRHKDRFGNEFRYRAKIYGANHQDLGRWAYDVFLQSTQ